MASHQSPSAPLPHNSFIVRFGHAMKQHQGIIRILQWTMVCIYCLLLFSPLLLAFMTDNTSAFHNLSFFSLFIFWGFGWPVILLSTMLFGRVWCGILCPDGTLTETASYLGQHRSIPKWMRWKGWHFILLIIFITTTILISASHKYDFTFFLLVTLTLSALITGFLFGNNRRIWCIYLCPSNMIFNFMARLSIFYFRVDQHDWNQYNGVSHRVQCAPLINIKQMTSSAECHACGRCSGYRQAVTLGSRYPGKEVLSGQSPPLSTGEALTFFLGFIGICTTAIIHPFVHHLFVFAHDYFININIININNIFIIPGGLLLGTVIWMLVWLSSQIAKENISWEKLAVALIPVAGIGFFIGVSNLTFLYWKPDIRIMEWIKLFQLVLLVASLIATLAAGWRFVSKRFSFRSTFAFAVFLLPVFLIGGIWIAHLYA